MENTLFTGKFTQADGLSSGPLRSSREGAQAIANAVPWMHEAVSRGDVYYASMQAGAALGTALTATAVTMTLYNPANSGKILTIVSGQVVITTAPAGGAVLVWAANTNVLAAAPTALTEATVRGSCLLGAGYNAVGRAYTAATLPAAPTVARVISSVLATGSTAAIAINDMVDGALCLYPNTAVTIQSIGTAESGIVSIVWQEVSL